jgi:hypothetical protein
MARLKDGVSIEQAQAEMSRIAAQLQTEYPKSNTNWDISVQPLHLNFLEKSTRRNLWLLLGAVGFLLLIGCVNVAICCWLAEPRVSEKSHTRSTWCFEGSFVQSVPD